MKLETFFQKFDLFADAPDAVTKMRELVLELAVQGKLVPRDPNDAPAEELLQQIELTRSRTGKTAKGRKLERLPTVEPDESPYETPHGWAWCRLGTLGLVGSSRRVHEKDWTTNGVPFLRAREIVKLAKAGEVDNALFITEEHYRRLAAEGLTPEPNDLMVTGVGTIGVPYVVRDTDRFYFKDASVLIFKNWFGLYPHYLHIVMQSPYWIREVHRKSMGTTVHTLTIVRAKQTPIPLPPLAEQKRIVAKVDEFMALCDRLEAQQQERETRHAALARASLARLADAPTPANLPFLFHPSYSIPPADLRNSILTLAVQGKLVPRDPNDAPAEELLQQIELTRSRTGKTAKGRKLERLPTVEPDESPYETPHGWAWCRLGTLGLVGSSRRVHEKDWTTNGVPFLRAREIVKLAKAGEVDNALFITEEHYRRLAAEGLTPEPNDLMVTGVGTIGVPYVVRDTDRFYFKDASVLIFKNWFGLYPHYLHIVMQSPYWIREVHRKSMGTTVHTLTIVRAKQTPIPLPPLAEQHRIVAKLDQLMILVGELETQLTASRATAASLLSALIAALTTQNGGGDETQTPAD